MSIVRVAAWLITVALMLVMIVVGKDYLMPIFLSLVIWYLVNALDRQFRRLPLIGERLPAGVTLGLSLVFIGLSLYAVGNAIVATLQGVMTEGANYLPRIDAQIVRIYAGFNLKDPPTLASLELMDQFWAYSTDLLNGLTNFAKDLFLVLLYVLFLLLEQGVFARKMTALGLPLQETNRLSVVLNEVNSAMRTYLGVKTFTSILTGVLSYAVFIAVGVDFALFWAFLVYLFNYVPTIGSITATILPSLLALVQFDTLSPFLVILVGVTAINLLVGNILEPRLMGDNLNISPLAVVLSLILWSMLWGVVGMLLSVPITVAIIIVCSQFETTRAVAVLLSKDGRV